MDVLFEGEATILDHESLEVVSISALVVLVWGLDVSQVGVQIQRGLGCMDLRDDRPQPNSVWNPFEDSALFIQTDDRVCAESHLPLATLWLVLHDPVGGG
jgi:hypothetical protein